MPVRHISQVDKVKFEISLAELIEFFPDGIGSEAAAIVKKGIPVFAHPENGQVGLFERREIIGLNIGFNDITHQFATGLLSIIIAF
jgi:hypothetical protein